MQNANHVKYLHYFLRRRRNYRIYRRLLVMFATAQDKKEDSEIEESVLYKGNVRNAYY